ncbi:uncharacterized protein LOC119736878 isoform X1 [Patiria miniata]|uniref:Tyr recombinase domain-containing protein n=1 Tax=Patiria miniata TaxID=46514 RepID=A0A914AU28_PATMI|nr:uncharacterized protein LOC119736878 isoform X1 [Patiria miniata]
MQLMTASTSKDQGSDSTPTSPGTSTGIFQSKPHSHIGHSCLQSQPQQQRCLKNHEAHPPLNLKPSVDKFTDIIKIILEQPFWADSPPVVSGSKEQLLHEAIAAKSVGSCHSYFYKCRQFIKWLVQCKIPMSFPVSEGIVAAYLSHTNSTSRSDSVMTTTASAIKWLHSLMNIKNNPIDSPIVQQLLISFRKRLHHPPVQKDPLSLVQLNQIVDKFAGDDCSLMQLRTACYVSLKFALLFRHNEIAEIKANHITPLPDAQGIKIVIPKSKTDIFREGNVAFLPTSQSFYSPYVILTRFMKQLGISIGDDQFIFTPLTFCSASNSYKRTQNKPLSYTRSRELFFDALKAIGVEDVKRFGLHSLRSGGATRLANNKIPEELIMQHGRWKTTTAKNRYIKRDLTTRLQVSKAVYN